MGWEWDGDGFGWWDGNRLGWDGYRWKDGDGASWDGFLGVGLQEDGLHESQREELVPQRVVLHREQRGHERLKRRLPLPSGSAQHGGQGTRPHSRHLGHG